MKKSFKNFSQLSLGQILSLILLVSFLLAVPLTFLKSSTSTISRAQKPTATPAKCPETAPLLEKECQDGTWQARVDTNGCPYLICQKFEPKEISFTLLLQGSWAKAQKTDQVIKTSEDYLALLKENLNLTNKPKIPKVDFKTQIVVASFLGETKEDCRIVIEKVEESANKISISLKETKVEKPPPKSTTYHPFIILRLPKTDKEIQFNHQTS
jgi:hypothetical protein